MLKSDPRGRDIPDAHLIHRIVYPKEKHYRYTQNIYHSGTMNLVAARENRTVEFISVVTNLLNPTERNLLERTHPISSFLVCFRNISVLELEEQSVRSAICRTFINNSCASIYLERDPSNKEAHKLCEKIEFENLAPIF